MTSKLYFEDIQVGDKFVGDTVVAEREKMLSNRCILMQMLPAVWD